MKKYMYVLCIASFLMSTTHAGSNSPLSIQVTAQHHEKNKLLLGVVGDLKEAAAEILMILKKDLEFSEQFIVDIRTFEQPLHTKSEVASLHTQGYAMAIFLSSADRGQAFEWRIYDTAQADMLKGKKYHKRGEHPRGWAHNIADAVWEELTARPGFFSTKIAYSKEVPGPKGHRVKHIYIADYDGSNAEPLVAKPTINVGPRWRPKIDQATGGPLLFFSQSTNKNMRLMVTNMHGNYKIASNTDGITMLPAFSADGTQVIYCASQGHGSCQLYHYHHGSIKQLTFEGNNISPTFSDDGTRIYYCSDVSGVPHIYCYQLATGMRSQITYGKEGCYSPAYSGKRQQLAYAKMIKGVMQLCVYDEVAKHHMQVTYDNEHKDECSWSPCGNYILCCAEKANKGRIALLDIHTGNMRSLTNDRDVCSYPAWSPVYDTYVTVT